MTNKKLFDTMRGIDPQYILDAAPKEKHKKAHSRVWMKWAAVAACFCFILTAGFMTIQQINNGTNSGNVNWPLSGEKVEEISWEDTNNISERYHELQFSGYSYGTTAMCLGKNYIGELIGDTELTGQDESGKQHVLPGKIYGISSISTDCAVAVTLGSVDIYYIYVNSSYRPNTLNEFIRDLNLDQNLSVGKVTYEKQESSGEYVKVVYDGLSALDLFEILFVNSETAELVENDDNMMLEKILSMGVSVPHIGSINRGIVLYEGGYISTNMLNSRKTFFVGAENVQALVDYVLQNCQESTVEQINNVNIAE